MAAAFGRLRSLGLAAITVERPAVVLEIGNAYTKIGFGGEPAPRHIIPSTVTFREALWNLYDPKLLANEEDLKQALIDFLFEVFFKYALVKTSERRIMICENPLCPTVFRQTLATVLFDHYKVISVFFAPNAPLTLLPLAAPTGLVVDCGHVETSVVGVSNNTALMYTFRTVPLGTQAVQQRIKDVLAASGHADVPQAALEDIMVRLCVAARPRPGVTVASTSYRTGATVLPISADVRLAGTDTLFALSDEDESVATAVLDALVRAPRDLRRELASHIVVVGGGSMLPGFASQLLHEMRTLFNTPRYAALQGPPSERVLHRVAVAAAFSDGTPGQQLAQDDLDAIKAHVLGKLQLDAAALTEWHLSTDTRGLRITLATEEHPEISHISGTIVLGQQCSFLFDKATQTLEKVAVGLSDEFAVFEHSFPEHALAWLGGALFASLELLPERSVTRDQFAASPRLTDWVQLPPEEEESPPMSAGPTSGRAPPQQYGRPKEWGAGVAVNLIDTLKLVP